MGTAIQKIEKEYFPHPELLNLIKPSVVLEIHKQYLASGCNVIFTNTFGANRLRLSISKQSFNLAKINQAGVELAKEAVKEVAMGAAIKKNVLIAGDMGPTGLAASLNDEMIVSMVKDAFKEQAECLVASGIDFLVLETFVSINEVLIAFKSVQTVTSMPILVLLSFGSNERTFDGYLPGEAAKKLKNEGITWIGINCGSGVKQALKLWPNFVNLTSLLLAAKPSAGLPDLITHEYPEDPENWSKEMEKLALMGAKILGGCCGTTPNHIYALARRLSILN